MLITILSITGLVTSLVILILIIKKFEENLFLHAGVFLVSIVFLLALFISLCFIIETQVLKQRDYDLFLESKEALEYRLESEGLVGNEFLYKDILKFNRELRKVKYGVNSIWLNWFYNSKVAEIEYIDYRG